MNQLRHNLATLAKNKKNQQENSRTLWQQWLQSTDCKNMDELNACVQEIQAYSEKFSRQSQQLLQNLPKFMQLLQKESVLEQELQTLQEALGEVLEIGGIELEELGSSEYLDENTATHYNRFFRQMIALENRESAMNSHAIVSTADIYGNIIYANDLFCEINGMAREELLGKNHRIVASGVHPRSFFTQMWETISQGETWHGEICNRTPAGKMYWVAATIMPFMGKDGLPEKYISVRTEITAQKNLELQLAQERLFLENVMHSLNEGVLVVDTNGRCVFMNPYAENLLGWQMYEAKDQALDIVMPLFLDNAATGHIKECQLIQKISSCQVFAWDENENLYLNNRQGKKIPIAASFTPLSQEEGKSNYVITLRDITARKEYQAAILQAKEAAENASQARASFLANMSHEIRTPMNAIIGFSEALLDSPLDSSQRRQLTTVRQAGHSLLRLLNEVLDMAKLEKGAVALEIADFSLRQICQLVVDTQRLAATKKGLTLTLHYPADVPDFFKGDALRLQQVLLNLLSNAVKFTQTGVVTLNVAYTPDGQLQLSVQDTGIGMSEEQLARIFDPFAQADASTTRRFGGTGLGTTIARQLVQLMGGDITVSSQQGQGSQFCVHLWLELGRAVGQEAEAVVQLPPLRILAADDIPDNLELLQLVLQRHGHSIRTASNGLEATRLYEQQEQAFDIILMDLHMPQMDGFEAARSIRHYEQQHRRSTTPILALSASVLEEDRQQAKQAGMQGFAHKPIHLPTLLKEIQRVLGLENSTSTSASTSAGTTAQSASSTRTSPDADILPPTLWNKAAALDLWGSQEAWQHALQRYMQQHQAAPERLKQLCAQADWPALKALAHSLRGVAANLQLLPIQAALQAIEQAVRQQPALQPPTPAQLAAFAQAWQQVQQALFAATAATAVDGSPSATTAPPSTSITLDEPQRQALATLLATLQADLACGQLPSEELLAQVSDLIANHHSLQALQEALEQFDFNQAQQHLQALQALAVAA